MKNKPRANLSRNYFQKFVVNHVFSFPRKLWRGYAEYIMNLESENRFSVFQPGEHNEINLKKASPYCKFVAFWASDLIIMSETENNIGDNDFD